jgi:RNA polymerase sigma-70 factor (ECF subfamily)
MTDEQIVGLVQNGDTRAFTELVRRHQDAVYAMALRFTADPGDAADVGQDAFLRAFRGLPGFKAEARFTTWLYRIVYNLCVDWLRKNRKARGGTVPIEDAGEVADGRGGHENAILAAEDRTRVNAAVAELEPRYRSVVVLLYYQRLSYEEISRVLGIPVKTVETRLYRARRMLREKLERA